MSTERPAEPRQSAPINARFLIDCETDGGVIYVEMEPMFEFAKTFMGDGVFERFELGVRRAADEMRGCGGAPRRFPWWKSRKV